MTLFDEWYQKQKKLDDISYNEWVEFGGKYPVQSGIDCMVEIWKLCDRQSKRDEKLLDRFPVFRE